MSTDYRLYKTPFFEISVGDSKGTKMVPLPHHILRLVSKVEIIETLEPGSFDTIKLTFVEASREPASPDASLGTDGLYKIPLEGDRTDMDVSGSLTNRPGVITDLRFSGSGGITFLTESEQRQNAIDRTNQKNVNDETTTRAYPREASAPQLIFQERNQILVKWGYLEDPSSVRTIRSYIAMVSVKFQESGQTTTDIVCNDAMAAADQITPKRGVVFGRRTKTGTGNSIITFQDQTTSELVEEICDRAGIPCIVSQTLPNQKLDKEHTKTWIAGESFAQFLNRLAARNNAIFKIIPDPKSGKDTLVYISKTEFDKRIVIRDRNLLTWKAPGSLLKNVNVNVDFANLPGEAQVGQNTDGTKDNINNRNDAENLQQFHKNGNKTEENVDTDPALSTNPISSAEGIVKNVLDGDYAYKVKSNPSDSIGVKQDSTNAASAEAIQRVIQLDFTSIGYTRITPGIVELRNLGVRYSGKYRIITATHILDNSGGYVTKAKCESGAFAAGGRISPRAPVTEDFEDESQVALRQFRDENESSNPNSVEVNNRFDQLKGLPKRSK